MPTPSLRRSFVKAWFKKSVAPTPDTRISPMCEISNRPAAFRTARCSSMMVEYCTGISQPPNSTSRAPSFWWAAKSGVLFNINASYSSSGEDSRSQSGFAGLQCISTPFLCLHLLFGHEQLAQNDLFSELDQLIWAACVKKSMGQL